MTALIVAGFGGFPCRTVAWHGDFRGVFLGCVRDGGVWLASVGASRLFVHITLEPFLDVYT